MKEFYVDVSPDSDEDHLEYTVYFQEVKHLGMMATWYIEVSDNEEEVTLWFELDVPIETPKSALIAKAFEYIEEHS